MTLAICLLDISMQFDFEFFEDHNAAFQHIMVIDEITPARGLFWNTLNKTFYRHAEIHIQSRDEFDVIDGRAITLHRTDLTEFDEIRNGIELLKTRGVTKMVFLHSERTDQRYVDFVSAMTVSGMEIAIASWSQITSL